MKLSVLFVCLLAVTATAQTLPADPSEAMVVHNTVSYAPKAPKTLDWRFITAHGVYAGSIAFDGYVTARGLNQPCGYTEGNVDLGANPSVKAIAIHGAVEFAAVTTMDYLLKRTHVPGLSYIGAAIGTGKHIRGGYQWIQTGCL